jgi:hypothetical protein
VALGLLGWSRAWIMGPHSTNGTGEAQITQGKGPRVMPGTQTYGVDRDDEKHSTRHRDLSGDVILFVYGPIP